MKNGEVQSFEGVAFVTGGDRMRCPSCHKSGFYSHPSGMCQKCRGKTKCKRCNGLFRSNMRSQSPYCNDCREHVRAMHKRYG